MSIDRAGAERAIHAFLVAIGRDPSQEPELEGTPARVTAAYVDELCDGYARDASSIVQRGIVGGSTGMVALRDVVVTTMCPHHLMPASGTGTIAFAPRGKLVGLGVMAELLDTFAHRLILQEEIGERVVAALAEGTGARWVACRLVLTHACITARGERKHGSSVETLAFVGDDAGRAEALAALGARP